MRWLARILSKLLPPPPEIAPGEEVVFLDVRSGPEFAAGHAAGAVHIPVGQVAARAHELEPYADRRILVYCLSGHRAAHAVRELKRHGIDSAENAGGIGGLRRIGVEMARGREAG